MTRLIISLILLIPHFGFSQKMDTTAYLKEINRVADSLRSSGDFIGCLHYFKEGLKLYPEPKESDFSGFDLSDTVYSYDYHIPHELFQRSGAYPLYRKLRFSPSLTDTVFNQSDSSLFSGLIVSCKPQSSAQVALYEKGKFIDSKYYSFKMTDSEVTTKTPFARCAFYRKDHFISVVTNRDYSLVRVLNSLGETSQVYRSFAENNFERIKYKTNGDTLSYEASLGYKNQEIQRGFSPYNITFPSGDYYYWENKQDSNTYSRLLVNQGADTLEFEQFVDDLRNGLHVYGYNYYPEIIKLRLNWKNDTVTDILNENILFLTHNMKVVSEEKYLQRNVITSETSSPIEIYSEQTIRVDDEGKTWIVLPYKVKNYSRFIQKLEKSRWKPRFP